MIPEDVARGKVLHLAPGDEVNVAKYVERILSFGARAAGGAPSGLTVEKLGELGYK